MKQFSMLQHPALGYEVVKDGWSWPAFFFTWIWAFVKRLWLVGLIILLVGMALSTVAELWLVGELIISIVMGVNGNKLRVNRLRDSGYEQVAIVAAKTPDGALAVHLTSPENENALPPEGLVR